jgi:ATP phosphoribosyltransferase regulatory subunit
MRKWILPEAIEDILPAEAARIESLRRRVLDHFAARGYRLVQPPLVEHLESLLTGTGRDLDLQTFKVVDPLSGRMLGVRADTTPQVARIDAHLLNEPGVTRLCYAGSVLRTTPAGPGYTREVVQIGAEVFGEPGIAGDREVVGLLLSSLAVAGLSRLHLDLGHVGVYRALAAGAGLAGAAEDLDLSAALRAKDASAVNDLTSRLPAAWRDALRALPGLYGPAREVLDEARARLPDTPAIADALAALAAIAGAAAGEVDALHVDLADLTGYHYQNGAIFSVFTSGQTRALGNGGRYDGIGKAFGRARPATGFTLDLRHLADVTGETAPAA